MTPGEADFIQKTIETEGKDFGYHKDQYAFDILSLYTKQAKDVTTVRKSSFGHLLEKPSVKEVMSKNGNNKLNSDLFSNQINNASKYFSYSIGTWGAYKKHRNDEWYQTSRSGINLVLQLNFDLVHNTMYFLHVQPYKK